MATTTNLLAVKIETSQSQKETTANQAFDIFDKGIAGTLSKAITTADVTLTDDEGRNAIISLTGTLTGNRNLIVPARSKIYAIKNGTSGAFTVTIKTAAGTGVLITQGSTSLVYCDATNVVALPGYLTVQEVDGSPLVSTVNKIRFSNSTVADDGNGQVTVTISAGGGSITVREADSSPTITTCTTLVFPNGSLTDNGGGQGTVSFAQPWNAITDPTGNQALSMAANTTTWTWGNATGASDLMTITDSTTNSSATGRALNISTTTGSTVRPLRVAAKGTEAIFVDQNAKINMGATTLRSTNSKLEVQGAGTQSNGDCDLRVYSASGLGSGITLEHSSHTWSMINKNNNELGFFHHASANYSLNTSYGALQGLLMRNNETQGLQAVWTPTATGGRQYALHSTANASALGGGNFALVDLTASRTRWITDSSGLNQMRAEPSTTNAPINTLTISGNSTGTPANGLGSAVLFQSETSTTENTDIGRVAMRFQDVTHASRTAFASVGTVSNAGSIVDRVVTGPRKTLTDATATSLFEIALPTLKGASGVIHANIFCTDGTDVQVRSTLVRYSAVNKGGTYTTEIVEVNSALSASAGTLDDTWTILNGTDKVTIQVNADTSLTPTTFYVTYTVTNDSEQAITVL